jgi:hypothetical protein
MRKASPDFLPRQLSGAAYLQIKAACRQLVKIVGGIEPAASVTRVGKTALAEYGSPDHPAFMPVDVVADLEAEVGRTPVTDLLRTLASEYAAPAAARPMTAPEALRAASASLTAAAGFARCLGEAADDGVISDGELTALIREADRLRRTIDDIHAGLVSAHASRREERHRAEAGEPKEGSP